MSKEKALATLAQAMGVGVDTSPAITEAIINTPEEPVKAESLPEIKTEAEQVVPTEKTPDQIREEILASIQSRRASKTQPSPSLSDDSSEIERLKYEMAQMRQQYSKAAKVQELIENGKPREALELAGQDINRFTAALVDESSATVSRQQEELLNRLAKLEKEREDERLKVQRETSIVQRRQRLREKLEQSGFSKSEELKLIRALNESPESMIPHLERWFPNEEDPDPADIMDYAKLAEHNTKTELYKMLNSGAIDTILEKSGWVKVGQPQKPIPKSGVPNGTVRSGTGAETVVSYDERKKRAAMILAGQVLTNN